MSKLVNWVKNYGKKTGATRIQVSFRLIAGAYLVYIAYSMVKELITGSAKPEGFGKVIYIAAIVLFGLFGLAYFALNARVYLKKDFFVPGRDDVPEDEETGTEDGAGNDGAEAPVRTVQNDYGEIGRAAHWVNPDADDFDEETAVKEVVASQVTEVKEENKEDNKEQK